MKNKYQALFWEQNRVAASAVGACVLGGMFVLFTMWMSPGSLREDPFAKTFAVVTILGAGVVLLLRQDPEGHLVTAFERRLARLPLQTFALVSIPLIVRLGYLLAASVVVHGLLYLLFDHVVSSALFLAPLVAYLAAQAFTWSQRTISGLDYALPAFLLALPAWFWQQFDWPERGGHPYLQGATWMLEFVMQPAPLLALGAGCFGWALIGVSLERRDLRVGLPTLQELWEWVTSRDEAPETPFASAEQAQLWYDRRRMLLAMPAMSLLLLAGLVVALDMVWFSEDLGRGYLRWLPGIALFLSAPLSGLPNLLARSQYGFFRPQTSLSIAHARLIILAESLFTAFTVLALATAAILYFFAPSYTGLLVDSHRHGSVPWLTLLTIVLAPLFCGGLGAWLFLGSQWTIGIIGAILGTVGVLMLFLAGMSFRIHDDVMSLMIVIGGAVLLLFPIVQWVVAWRLRVLSAGGLRLAVGVWIGLALLLWAISPTVAQPAAGFLFSLTFTGLLVAPVLSLPLEIHRKRHI